MGQHLQAFSTLRADLKTTEGRLQKKMCLVPHGKQDDITAFGSKYIKLKRHIQVRSEESKIVAEVI